MNAKKTIMVVDDNKDFVTVVGSVLEKEGYAVQCAHDGEEVFSLLQKNKPDLILLDIMMPRIDGLEVLARLKGSPESSSIPVILLTAKGQYGDILTGYRLGTDYYITKPFTSAQLFNGIHLLMDDARS